MLGSIEGGYQPPISNGETTPIEVPPDYGGFLYTLIDKFAAERRALEQLCQALYEQVEELRRQPETTKTREQIGELEKEYYKALADLTGFSAYEEALVLAISQWEDGNQYDVSFKTLHQEALHPQGQEGEKLSKYKQWVRDMTERTGEDPRNIEGHTGHGADGFRVNTGRNQKHLRTGAGISPDAAAGVFFYETADTHGGKRRRSRSREVDMWTTQGGRKIRKK